VLADNQKDGVNNGEKDEEGPGVKKHNFHLVPKRCLGTLFLETLFRSFIQPALTRNRVSSIAFPNGVWERDGHGKAMVRWIDSALCAHSETQSRHAPDTRRRNRESRRGVRTTSGPPRWISTTRREGYTACRPPVRADCLRDCCCNSFCRTYRCTTP